MLVASIAACGAKGGVGGTGGSGGAWVSTGGQIGNRGSNAGTGGAAPGDASDGGHDALPDLVFDDVPQPGIVRVVLQGTQFGPSQGYDIATNMVVEDGFGRTDADFFLSLRQINSLASTSPGSAGFCRKGTRFMSPLDVPLDASGCSSPWGVADLASSGPHPQSKAAGLGFVARDRNGNLAARLVIVDDWVQPDGRGEVTFDLARAGLM